MSDTLDLSVVLTSPPRDAPEGTVAAVSLACDALGLSHTGGLFVNPLTAAEQADLTWYLETYWQWPYLEFAERGERVARELLPDAGRRLYGALFSTPDAVTVLQAWRLSAATHRQFSILSTVPQALSLPWELLHDEQGFLALRTQQPVSIRRRLPQTESPGLPVPFAPPLRVLLVTARPKGTGFVDPHVIARELLDALEEPIAAGKVALEFLRPPTLPALRRRLRDISKPVHVLHFDGHGAFPEAIVGAGFTLGGDQGQLAFENEDGSLQLVPADMLAQVLQNSGVRLAVLTACQSAQGAADDAFSSVAARLIQSGVDAAVAMSASILVVTAARYAKGFYDEVAQGTPVPLSHERARQGLHDDAQRHPFRRGRDEPAMPVSLQDWWLPHFYQQRPLTLRLEAPAPLPILVESHLEGLPSAPRYGFQGRARELLAVERALQQGKQVALYGFGGMGKTALAAEAARWLTRTGLYGGACFISFEGGGEAGMLIGALGRHLGLHVGAFNPADIPAALEMLRTALRDAPTLVIADNLESVLPGGESALEETARRELWGVLRELSAASGCGVIVTSRTPEFGDARMAPGMAVLHQPLEGLHPDDASALAVHVLANLGIPRIHAPYADLRDLLVKLDHLPLAIELMLPALRELPLARIKTDFDLLLLNFTDNAEHGRNGSLVASLRYSLQRLTEAQQALLTKLAVFEIGFVERFMLDITEMSLPQWTDLRSALERASLISTKTIEGMKDLYIHTHPVLLPFLRSQATGNDAELEARYAEQYHHQLMALSFIEHSHPHASRAVVKDDLPNFRRALVSLFDRGQRREAVEMAGKLANCLSNFGLLREMDLVLAKLVSYTQSAENENLTMEEYIGEIHLGFGEVERGDPAAATDRLSRLLARQEAIVSSTSSPGPYELCGTMLHLAECLRAQGQSAAAAQYLRDALHINERDRKIEADFEEWDRQRIGLHKTLGDVLKNQGDFDAAQGAFEAAWKLAEQLSDQTLQAVLMRSLGEMALEQENYPLAKEHFTRLLEFYRSLKDLSQQAYALHHLGNVAGHQRDVKTAEAHFRESIALYEQIGDSSRAGAVFPDIGYLLSTTRPEEAENWYRRALSTPGLNAFNRSSILNDLAKLLADQVAVGRFPASRLVEAKSFGDESLTLLGTLENSAEPWITLNTLAQIADLMSQPETAKAYRRREREGFASFPGSRWQMDTSNGGVFPMIALAICGDDRARGLMEPILSKLEERRYFIRSAYERMAKGERDWHALSEGLSRGCALLVLRILETIKDQEQTR